MLSTDLLGASAFPTSDGGGIYVSPHPQKLFTPPPTQYTSWETNLLIRDLRSAIWKFVQFVRSERFLQSERSEGWSVSLSDTIWGSSWIIGCIDHCTKSHYTFEHLSMWWTFKHLSMWLCTLEQQYHRLHWSLALKWASHYTLKHLNIHLRIVRCWSSGIIWTSEHVNIWLCTLVQLHQSFALQWASHYTQTFR